MSKKKKKKNLERAMKEMNLRGQALNALICAVWDLMRETDFAPQDDEEFIAMIDEYVNWSKEADHPTKKSVKYLEDRLYHLSLQGFIRTTNKAQEEKTSEEKEAKPETGLEIAKRILG